MNRHRPDDSNQYWAIRQCRLRQMTQRELRQMTENE
jgi:hypothetical protein